MNIELWKKRKKELKLTYDKLAEISGISRRTIAGIFGGDSNYQSPTFNTVQAIEKALGLDGVTTAETPSRNTVEERLLTAFNKLVPAMQVYALEMIEKLVQSQIQ